MSADICELDISLKVESQPETEAQQQKSITVNSKKDATIFRLTHDDGPQKSTGAKPNETEATSEEASSIEDGSSSSAAAVPNKSGRPFLSAQKLAELRATLLRGAGGFPADQQTKELKEVQSSKVVHLRNVAETTKESDLIVLALPFGRISNVLILKGKKQALIEMESIERAMLFIDHLKENQVNVGGRKLMAQFSTHQQIRPSLADNPEVLAHPWHPANNRSILHYKQRVAGNDDNQGFRSYNNYQDIHLMNFNRNAPHFTTANFGRGDLSDASLNYRNEDVDKDKSGLNKLKVSMQRVVAVNQDGGDKMADGNTADNYPVSADTLRAIFSEYGHVIEVATTKERLGGDRDKEDHASSSSEESTSKAENGESWSETNGGKGAKSFATISYVSSPAGRYSARRAKECLDQCPLYNGYAKLRVDYYESLAGEQKSENESSETDESSKGNNDFLVVENCVDLANNKRGKTRLDTKIYKSRDPLFHGTRAYPYADRLCTANMAPGYEYYYAAEPLNRACHCNLQQRTNSWDHNNLIQQPIVQPQYYPGDLNMNQHPGAYPYYYGYVDDSCWSTPVLLASNLSPEMTIPDRLFNLFGAFGDVQRVRVLFHKRDSALIQMTNGTMAQVAMRNLDKCTVFGRVLRVTPSIFARIESGPVGVGNVAAQGCGGDGSADLWGDYGDSPYHRFRAAGSKNYRNIYPPSPTLHLSNVPEWATEADLVDLFTTSGFEVKSFRFLPTEKRMGLINMASREEAIKALVLLHNATLKDRYTLKVSFARLRFF